MSTPGAPQQPQPAIVSSTFQPIFEASLNPSAKPAQPPATVQNNNIPSFAPIILESPISDHVGGGVGGSPLPTVPPEVDLSTSQQPAVVKAGEDYYYYYYYYDDEDESGDAAAGGEEA